MYVFSAREGSTFANTIGLFLFSPYDTGVLPNSYRNRQANNCTSFEAILTNEFRTLQGSCSALVPQGPGYENVTLANQVCTAVGAVPGQPFVDGSNFLLLSYGFKFSHTWMVRKVLMGNDQNTQGRIELRHRPSLFHRILLSFASFYGTQYQHVPRAPHHSLQTWLQTYLEIYLP